MVNPVWPRNQLENSYIIQAEDMGMLTIKVGEDAQHNPDRACGELKQYFDDLESLLTRKQNNPDHDQPKVILTEISQFLQSQENEILGDGYTCLLDRLTQIYTQGLEHHDNHVFTDTAANYAGVIQLVSQTHSAYDYSEVIGQLLHYMNQLYKNREKSWLRIFKHLLSMPDSIQGIQTLKERHLNEIQQWIEEGVDNLFELRDDQIQLYSEKIAELASAEERVEQQLQDMEVNPDHHILPITWLKDKATLKTLIQQRDLLIEDLENRQELVDLLEQNMQEFEEILLTTRRAYLIHSV